jgi:hypothetical protein
MIDIYLIILITRPTRITTAADISKLPENGYALIFSSSGLVMSNFVSTRILQSKDSNFSKPITRKRHE